MSEKPTIFTRIHRSLGPIAGAIILDSVDLATFGPFGIFGLFIGFGVGWWLGCLYGFKTPGKITCAIVSGIYCLIPFTAPFPIATIISAIARFFQDEKSE